MTRCEPACLSVCECPREQTVDNCVFPPLFLRKSISTRRRSLMIDNDITSSRPSYGGSHQKRGRVSGVCVCAWQTGTDCYQDFSLFLFCGKLGEQEKKRRETSQAIENPLIPCILHIVKARLICQIKTFRQRDMWVWGVGCGHMDTNAEYKQL